ncbi:MAG: sigma 54-interacting transcriptional regulator [Planctomycetota bacterium]|jgi:PAS domain S-box-containing protein
MSGKNMKANILVVDDDERVSFVIKRLLVRDGHEVSTAANYNEAMDKLSQAGFDMILTDINLGDRSGIDILREVKKREMVCPVIMNTGNPNIETATEAVRLGAHDYIMKPIQTETLTHVTCMALQYKSVVEEKNKYQANLEAIFRSVRDAIITVDRELRVLEVNEAAEELYGFPGKDEIKGKKCEFFMNKFSEKYLELITETINTKRPAERYRFECESKYQSWKVVSATTYPLVDTSGQFNGCVMVVKDETRLAELESNLNRHQQFHNIIGKSGRMEKVFSLIDTLSDTQTTVLITGESGTGKGLVAEALHYYRKDSKRPFVVVGCASLSDNLLESELFGHVKGAFTGAVSDRVGRFQKADGGTIFLDEIGEISNSMQLRLLRVLQEMEFERVGDSTPVRVNVRVIAATNQDLLKKVRNKSFREDLYHRLNVVKLTIPPLRERKEDIPLLVDHFLKVLNGKLDKNIKSVSEDVLKVFMDYKWPGNIRELLHTMEHAFIICKETIITIEDLPSEFGGDGSVDTQHEKEDNTRNSILQALIKTGWNRAKAARLLRIGRTTLYAKIEKYQITENRSE